MGGGGGVDVHGCSRCILRLQLQRSTSAPLPPASPASAHTPPTHEHAPPALCPLPHLHLHMLHKVEAILFQSLIDRHAQDGGCRDDQAACSTPSQQDRSAGGPGMSCYVSGAWRAGGSGEEWGGGAAQQGGCCHGAQVRMRHPAGSLLGCTGSRAVHASVEWREGDRRDARLVMVRQHALKAVNRLRQDALACRAKGVEGRSGWQDGGGWLPVWLGAVPCSHWEHCCLAAVRAARAGPWDGAAGCGRGRHKSRAMPAQRQMATHAPRPCLPPWEARHSLICDLVRVRARGHPIVVHARDLEHLLPFLLAESGRDELLDGDVHPSKHLP